MGPTRDEHLDRERQNASVCDWNGKPDGVFRNVCQRGYFLFLDWIVALAGYSRADSGRRVGCSFERSAGREVAGAVDVCAGGGYGYFLEFTGFVEDLVRFRYALYYLIVRKPSPQFGSVDYAQ